MHATCKPSILYSCKKLMNIAAIVFSERAILSLPKTRVEPKWVVCSSKPDRSIFLLLLPHLWLSSTLLQATLMPMLSPWTSWALDSESAWPKWPGTWARWKALTHQTHCACASSPISAPAPPSGRRPWWRPPWPTTITPCTHTTGQPPSTTSPQPCSNPTDSTRRSQPRAASPRRQKCLPPTALPCSQPRSPMPILPFGCPRQAPWHRVCRLSPPLSCLFRPPCMPQPQRPPQLPTASLCLSQGPFPCSPPMQQPQPQWLQPPRSAHPCQCRPPPALSRQAVEQTVNLTDPGGQKSEPFKLFLFLAIVTECPSFQNQLQTSAPWR